MRSPFADNVPRTLRELIAAEAADAPARAHEDAPRRRRPRVMTVRRVT
ncbi:hypothetical protein [Spirillospora albida]|nr:hypothetical protein [Spirillospora albida]